MRKLILTSVTFKVGEHTNEIPHLVVLNQQPGDNQTTMGNRAVDAVLKQFKECYPEAEIISVVARPTFGDYPVSNGDHALKSFSKKQNEGDDIGMQYPQFHESTDLPEDIGEGVSEDVLIDVDGWRKKFITGWYDFDEKEWKSDYNGAVKIDQVNMKWTRLPFAK